MKHMRYQNFPVAKHVTQTVFNGADLPTMNCVSPVVATKYCILKQKLQSALGSAAHIKRKQEIAV